MNKKKIQACQLCNKKYNGVFVSEHICKRCTRSVCKDCADKKGYFFIAAQNKKSQHRICNACWIDIAKIQSIIKQYDIKYNQLSILSKNWINFAKIQQKKAKNIQVQKCVQKIKDKIKKLNLSSYWPKLNYSFRTFLGSCTIKSKQYSEYLKVLNEALSQINYCQIIDKQIRNQQIQGLIQNQIKLSLFFLCHSSIKNFSLIHSYYTNVLKQCSLERTIQKFKMILIQNNKDKLTNQKLKDLQKSAIKYLKCNFNNILKNHVNLFHIQVVNWIINQIFLSDNGTELFQIFIAYILYTLKNFCLENNDDLIDAQMFKSIDLKQIQLPIKFLKARLSKQEKIQIQKTMRTSQKQQKHKEKQLKNKEEEQMKIKQQKQKQQKQKQLKQKQLKYIQQKQREKQQKQKNKQKNIEKTENQLNQEQEEKSLKQLQREKKFTQDQKEIKQNLSAAKILLDKIQAGQEISQQYLLSLNIDNLDQYLDEIIRRNDQDLQQLEEMDKMIDKVHFKIQNQGL